jgi:tripartite-type tricarboxylate transporter receptor subunit TctC
MWKRLWLIVGIVPGVLSPCPLAAPASADEAVRYPTRTVRIVVPFSAGSLTDLLARTLSEKLDGMWKQPVIVENHPGIAGTAGVAKAAPDGYTLLLASNGHTVIKVVNPDLPFDPIEDFVGISKLASMPLILIAPLKPDHDSLANLIRLSKSKPEALSYASAGFNGTSYIAGEYFKKTADLNVVHIPYKGTPDAQTSIIRGDTDFFFPPAVVSDSLIKAGQVRALAVTGPARVPSLPDVPTFREAGMGQFEYDAWFGLLAPAGTPKEILKKISNDIAKVVSLPDVGERLRQQGTIVTSSTPEQFQAVLRADAARYAPMLRK